MYTYSFSIIFLICITFSPSKCEGLSIECDKPNEHYECGSACQKTCDNIGENCTIINKKCTDACYCDDGYARNATGVCIPIEKCPPKYKCNTYEYYACGSACQTECSRLGEICANETKVCKHGCYCIQGYARDNNNQCVPIKDCPNMPLLNCDKPHEHYECGSACQTTCDNYKKPCLIQNIKCNEQCYCNDKYARDKNGRCIPVWQCPDYNGPKKCYKDNEHYQIGQVCEKRCATLGKPCNYMSTYDGCYCNEGYARNVIGDCIPIEQCPPKDCCPCPSTTTSPPDCASDSSDSSNVKTRGCGCY